MPFIWNDDQMQFLENSVDFDKSQYVIVRKLFVQFKEHVKVKLSFVVCIIFIVLYPNKYCLSGYR